MIKIDRYSKPTPSSLVTKKNKTDNERDKAEAYYAKIPAPKTAFKFKKYKENDVVSTLKLLFNGKCAYCESKYIGTQVMDVEHYRPKGGVNECPTHIGYWWLALEWENLLPSCIDCNRRRGHKVVELIDGAFVTTINDNNTGKENSFPVANSFFAMKKSDDHKLEQPLLINPCEIDPHEHLVWFTENEILPIVKPKVKAGIIDLKGEKTISVLGLNRWGLVNERAETLQQLAVIVAELRNLISAASQTPPSSGRDSLFKIISDKIDHLRTFGEPNKQYSAMCKDYIEINMKKIKVELSTLIQNNN